MSNKNKKKTKRDLVYDAFFEELETHLRGHAERLAKQYRLNEDYVFYELTMVACDVVQAVCEFGSQIYDDIEE